MREKKFHRFGRRRGRFEGDPAAESGPLHHVDVRVDQTGQQRASVPVDHSRRETVRSGRGDRGDQAVVDPDVREFAAQARPHPAEQKIVHATTLPGHIPVTKAGKRATERVKPTKNA